MKKATGLLLILTMGLVAVLQLPLAAQDTTKMEKQFKNTIHFNITNPLIFGGRSLIFGYERILKKNRSFTINVGQTGFPTLSIINPDSVRNNRLRDQKGFNISGDYRFYLGKENKYDAPRGVYIGPYFSYNYFRKDHSWDITTTSGGTVSVESQTSLKASAIGFELGYQFVFWNRVSLDLVLAGPGIGIYKLKAALGTNLSEADRAKLLEKLNDALAEKFPGYNVVIDEDEFLRKGTANTTTLGYRYMVQIGFRF